MPHANLMLLAETNVVAETQVAGLGTFAPGVYTIVPVIANGIAVDLRSQDDKSVQIMTDNGNIRQRWHFTWDGHGWNIHAEVNGSSYYIQPEDHDTGNGDELEAVAHDASDFQRWLLYSAGNGFYALKNSGSGKWMQTDNGDSGNQLEQEDYENEARWHWILRA